MKREVYESQKAFAGEKKPSFLPHEGQVVFCCLRPVSLGVSSW
jgi:hypothetical protein